MTSRTGRSRALLCALAFGAALAPGVAHAQVPGLPPILQPPDDDDPPTNPNRPPPALPPALANAHASEDGISAARSNYSADDTLIPPLERRWKRGFTYDVRTVLVGDRTVFVQDGGRVVALAGRSGKTLWSKVPGSGATAISFEGGRLVALTDNGRLAAFDGVSGRLLWERAAPDRSVLGQRIATVSGMVVMTADETVYGLSIADGSLRWSRHLSGTSMSLGPTIDNGRVFVVCGTKALALSDGRRLWSDTEFCNDGGAMAGGGLVAGQEYRVRNASSGALAGRLPSQLQVIAPSVSIFQNGTSGPLTGHRGLLGPRIWATRERRYSCSSSACSRAIGGGANSYRVLNGRVTVNDLGTGRRRWSGGPRIEGASTVPPPVAGDGLLVVRQEKAITGYTSVLNPKPTSLQEGTFEASRPLGARARLFGALGRTLRAQGPADVVLQSDRFPYRRFRSEKRTRTFGDGGFGFSVRPRRNTRYRTVSRGKRSRGGTVYVYPRYRERVRRGRGRRINKLRSHVAVRVPRGVRLRGKRVHLYLVRVARRRVQRIGRGARLRVTGRGRARGTIRYNAIRGIRRRDYLFLCIRGMSRQGMGEPDVYDRRCGRRRLPF